MTKGIPRISPFAMIGSIIAVEVNVAARIAVHAPVRVTNRSSVSPA